MRIRAIALLMLGTVCLGAIMGCQANLGKQTPPLPLLVAHERKYAYVDEKLAVPGVTVSKYVETMDGWDKPDTLVVAHRGDSASTGYGIRITKILRTGDGLLDVYVLLLNPTPGSIQADVITQPVDMVRIEGWRDDWRFRLVVENTVFGPYAPEMVSFTPYALGSSTPEGALGRPMPDELGVGVLPLVAQTDRIDTALIVHRALCPTGGYSIEVTKITRNIDGMITVYVKLTNPAPGSIQTQAITQPVDVVKIEGHSREWTYRVIVE